MPYYSIYDGGVAYNEWLFSKHSHRHPGEGGEKERGRRQGKPQDTGLSVPIIVIE